jgi:peptidoglycan/xylan/chitin deacetylase (PgdA/CDA1 family)
MKAIIVKRRVDILLLTLGVGCVAHAGFAADNAFRWPNGARAAVSLAYDDAIDSQLDNAIPALNKYGLKGTFYLVLSSETLAKRLDEWRAAAGEGHELANHTLFHQCSRSAPGREWVAPDNDLDRISVGQLAAQVRVGNSMLHAIDGRTARTFTTPCGDLKAGGENYVPAIRSEFVAIKSAFGGVTPDMKTLDPYAVSVTTPTEVTGQQLIDVVKEAAARGTMANFTFHGVGGDYLAVSKEAHEELLQYLAANKNVYWTDTFINIMTHVKEQQETMR